MGDQAAVSAVGLVLMAIWSVCAADTLADQCSDSFEKLPTCLTFATGKAATPTKDCCTSVTTIKESKPVCLCYIIQQIHTGANPQLKSFGIQETKLLQLPSACKLTNASTADCPKLLKIPANSPDAAIFMDPSSTPAASAAAKGTPAPVKTDDTSNGIKPVPVSVSISSGAIFFFFFFFYALLY